MHLRFTFWNCFSSWLLIIGTPSVLRSQAPSSPPASSSSSKPHSTSKAAHKPPSLAQSPLDAGSLSAGVYRNLAFGFTCRIPAGWVLRTDEMNAPNARSENAQSEKAQSEKAGAEEPAADAGQDARVLLAAFSRPPQARAEDVNASIVIAAESAATYPGLKDAAQYFGPVTEVAKAQGFEVDEEPYEFVLGTKTLARGDFRKDVGTRVMRQSTLVLLDRGYAVSFTFIGGTEDEVEELIGNLSFTAAKAGK